MRKIFRFILYSKLLHWLRKPIADLLNKILVSRRILMINYNLPGYSKLFDQITRYKKEIDYGGVS